MKHADALTIAQDLVEQLTPFCARIEIAGSLRRRKAEVGDIDLVLITQEPFKFLAELMRVYGRKPEKIGPKIVTLSNYRGIQVDCYLTDERTWPTLLLIRTGSKEHNIALAKYARVRGLQLKANGDGLLNLTTGKLLSVQTEADIFAALKLGYREPWEREA